jgi:hypothetical protein
VLCHLEDRVNEAYDRVYDVFKETDEDIDDGKNEIKEKLYELHTVMVSRRANAPIH